MDDNGTYLGNIYGIYKACIANISIDIYDIKYKMKPARGPQTEFFSNSCSGIPGLANAAELGKSRQV